MNWKLIEYLDIILTNNELILLIWYINYIVLKTNVLWIMIIWGDKDEENNSENRGF